jgi:hypothetical protein
MTHQSNNAKSRTHTVYALLTQYHLDQYSLLLMQNGFDSLMAISAITEPVLDVLGIVSLNYRALFSFLTADMRAKFPVIHQQM